MLERNKTHLVSTVIGAVGVLALAWGCGGSDDPAEEGAAGAAGTPDVPCDDCIEPPEQPPGAPAGDGPGTTLAVNKLYLGDTDRTGTPNLNAWKDFGYDLDGFKSTKTSGTHCKLDEASQPSVKTDGNNGIDNSFGSQIMPIISTLAPDATAMVNETINEGSFTIILDIAGIGGGTNYANLSAALYAGSQLQTCDPTITCSDTEPCAAGDCVGGVCCTDKIPVWDGTDEWQVFCELMNTCQPTGTPQLPANTSKVLFPGSYVAEGVWVSGAKGVVSLSLSFSGQSLSLSIREAVLTARLAAGNPPASATEGIIAGVLDTEELINSLRAIAGNLDPSLCEGPTFESIAQQIRATSDIMVDGTQNPDATCNGISIGIGFEMMPVTLGTVLDTQPPGDDPCAPQ